MKENISDPNRSPSPPARPVTGVDAASLFGKGKYKAWALAAIILLAFWSMLTGTVTLNFSSRRHGLLLPNDDLIETPLRQDLDILEMEEREKVVKRMWEIYLHSESERGSLPRFWQEAFEAAYEDLAGDDEWARDSAVSEIATMSLGLRALDPDPTTIDKKEEKENSGNKARKLMAL